MDAWINWITSAQPELVWGLFSRGLGLIYLISFVSLGGQATSAVGREGGIPVSIRLAKMREDFPGWKRFFYFPTLLWLNDSDAMLRGLTIVGGLAAIAVMIGGPFAWYALLICYVCYLSLDLAMALIFPWDCLLFESTVLAFFLPATHWLPELSAVAAPAASLTWAYRLLAFRVMFGFGKQKFLGAGWKDLAYLKGFLINQPLPSPVAWYVQKLPTWMLYGLVIFMFFVEIPAPFFAFFPGILSVIFAISTILLMIGIQSMGSFGYFSLLTIVLSIALFDNQTPWQLSISNYFGAGQPNAANAYVLVHTLSALFAFPFNSWVGQNWHKFSFWYRLPRAFQLPFDFFRFMHPLRWLHPYGVFPPHMTPSVKITVLIEVSWDGENWQELEFLWSPCNERSKPKFVAPHHPRGDQAIIYDTFGLSPSCYIAAIFELWDPYGFNSQPGSIAFMQRLLEGKPLDAVHGETVKKFETAPKWARIRTVMLEPRPLDEANKTGKWWKRTYVGPHIPARQVDPNFWDEAICDPELWHFDSIFWRRRSRLKPIIDRAQNDAQVDPMKLVMLNPSKPMREEDIDKFWNEFVPLLSAETRSSFDNLPDTVATVRERFSHREQRSFYRILNRFSLILVAKLEPLFLGRTKPLIPAKTYFHLWMAAEHLIANGKDAYLAAVADPMSVASVFPELTTQSGLYAQSIFRYEATIFDAQKLRLIHEYVPPYDAEAKAKAARDVEELPDHEKALVKLGQALFGFFEIGPVIRDNFKGPRFNPDDPEMYPTFKDLPSGEVVVEHYANGAPSDGSAPDSPDIRAAKRVTTPMAPLSGVTGTESASSAE